MRAYAVVDVETTGLPRDDWARVAEIGAVAYDWRTGAEVSQFHSYVLPDVLDERADRALAYCGLSVERLVEAPAASAVSDAFDAWLVDNNVQRCYAYNRVFDEAMLLRSGFTPLPWGPCLMTAARKASGSTNLSLAKACEYFRVPMPVCQHRALDDARAAGALLDKLHRQGVV